MREENQEIKERDIEAPWLFLAGPFFLLCTFAVATWSNDSMNLYWLAAALIGMTLCACYKLRGCVFAIILLGLISALKHGFLITDHFWQFGLESSLACGLLITSLTLDQRKSLLRGLQETANIRGSTISNLEEELAKLMGTSQSQQIFLQEKLVETQKEREESQSEVSSILILNEVLRKTTARQTEEAEQLAEGSLDKQRRIASLLDEIDALQNELARVSDLSGVAKENARLLEELNCARSDRAQTDLLNEMLAHYAKEAEKAPEITEVIHVLREENQAIQEELKAAKEEVQMLSEISQVHFKESQAIQEELEAAKIELQTFSEISQAHYEEKLAIQKELEAAKEEVQTLTETSQAHYEENQAIQEELGAAKEEVQMLSETSQAHFEDSQAIQKELGTAKAQVQMLSVHLQQASRESERLAGGVLDKQRRIESLLDEINAMQNELARVNDLSDAAKKNAELLDELNSARADREQTHLMNEMLTRLNVTEAQKTQTSSETLHGFHAEKQAVQEELGAAKAEVQMLSVHLQQVSEELARALGSLKKFEPLQLEKRFLQERLQAAELELASISQKMKPSAHSSSQEKSEKIEFLDKLSKQELLIKNLQEELKTAVQATALHQQLKEEIELKTAELHESRIKLFQADTQMQQLLIEKKQLQSSVPQSSSQENPAVRVEKETLLHKLTAQESLLDGLEERLKNVAQTETLYKQLKEQFEEKNSVLHDTRAKLFRADTQLQQLLIEKEHHTLEEKPISKELENEISSLEQEVSELREENDQLQEIITSLSSLETPPPGKKKLKKVYILNQDKCYSRIVKKDEA
jgi:chromosome segregation ATPase